MASAATKSSTVSWFSFLPPLLFAAYPLLALFAHNQTEIELSVLWKPLAVCVAVAAALYWVFMFIFKRGTKAGAMASLVCIAFFYFGIFLEWVSRWSLSDVWFLVIWLVLVAIGAVALTRSTRPLVNLSIILIVGASVLIFFPIARIVTYQANHPAIATTDTRLWPTALENPAPPSGARLPDIYVIIPDDYARTDVLRQYFHYDNRAFIGELEKRGFVIADQARSPYSDSELNIAAALNMDYMSALPAILGKDSQDVRPLQTLNEDNRASHLLASLGYRYVHLDTDEVTFAGGNPNISPVGSPDSFANLWMQQSVLRAIGGPLGFNDASTDERFRESIRSTFADLAATTQIPSPKFVVFHTLLPHDPYIFGAQGQSVTFEDVSGEDHGAEIGMKYYLEQLRDLNRRLLEVVDAIQADSAAPPVIVLQSDEGFEMNEDVFGKDAMQQVRVKGLLALSLPGADSARVPRALNTVNTLRFVFNQYFGTQYDLLPSASYPEGDLPYQFEEMPVP